MNNSSHMNRKSRMISRYLLAVLFILLVSSRQVSDSFINMIQESNLSLSPSTSQILYSVAAVLLFSFFYYMLTCSSRRSEEDEEEQENFFFIPTPREDQVLGRNDPRDAVYKDNVGVTFNFDSVGSGMCSSAKCTDEGIIKGCPGRNNLYGEGGLPRFM
jgi:hypothetical protein